jgi:hypothetical protein
MSKVETIPPFIKVIMKDMELRMGTSNPFEDSYLKQELEFYGDVEYSNKHLKVHKRKLSGRCDDYLNVNFRTNDIEIPILIFDKILWMSLTYMEVESLYLPILLAQGEVGTAGLGLGYFPLRVAAKSEVEQVDVYEKNPHVIKFFIEMFRHRKGFEKINIIHGDVRELCVGKYYDFFFADMYPEMLDTDATDDLKLLTRNNEIEEYHFWTQELALFYTLIKEEPVELTYLERIFFYQFFQTEKSKMHRVSEYSDPWIKTALELLNRL